MFVYVSNAHVSVTSGQTWSWNLCIEEETCVLEEPVQLPSAHVSVSSFSLTCSFFYILINFRHIVLGPIFHTTCDTCGLMLLPLLNVKRITI